MEKQADLEKTQLLLNGLVQARVKKAKSLKFETMNVLFSTDMRSNRFGVQRDRKQTFVNNVIQGEIIGKSPEKSS